MFLARLFVLMVPLLAVSCQSEVGQMGSPRARVEKKLTTLEFPMTRAKLTEHFPAIRLEKAPRVLLTSVSTPAKGTEYCSLGDGLTLVMPVDYKYGVSQKPSSSSGGTASGGTLGVRTDAGDVVKGAMIAVDRAPTGPVCVNCSTDRYMKMLHAGL